MKKQIIILTAILFFLPSLLQVLRLGKSRWLSGSCFAQWSQLQKIVASDRDGNDEFGLSVSISGTYAIVGAFVEDEDATGGNNQPQAGSAYIYEYNGTNWVEVQKIVASDRTTGDWFGYSVSISGNYAIVGAQTEDEDAIGGSPMSEAGSAYIFERNGAGAWLQVQKIVASDRTADDHLSHFPQGIGIFFANRNLPAQSILRHYHLRAKNNERIVY